MADRIILITGATRGIGRFLAETFRGRGCVVVGCGRSETAWEADNFDYQSCDVSDEKAVVKLVRGAARKYGRLDAVLNCAGVASMNHSLLTPASSMEKLLKINVIGTMLVCREAAKAMKKTGGRIVNFSSVAVPMQIEGEAVYAASKAAVETFTKVFAREVAPFGVTCNIVAPSPIDTDLIRGVPAETIEALVKRMGIKRKGTFEDVLQVVDFFLSEKSDGVSGQTIYLGGVS